MKVTRRPCQRRAAVAALVLISLFTMLGCLVLSVDVGHVLVTHGEMQAAMDASALAGASGLPLNNGQAHIRAMEFADGNYVNGAPIAPHELTLTIGKWNSATKTFVPDNGGGGVVPSAIRVVGIRDDVPMIFAAALGVSTTTVGRAAIATYGGGVCLGVWGLEGLNAQGNLTSDSYDSGLGPYSPGNMNASGDICSNQNVVLEGNVEIFGDVMYGEGYGITTFGSAFDVWGVMTEHRGSVPPPTIDMAAAMAVNDNAIIGLTNKGNDPFGGTQWDFAVSGNDSLTINGGTYYFTSALIEGQATVTITGPTTIYVSGDASFGGKGIINVTQVPSNLTIYSTGNTLTVNGSAGFYGAIIAPQTIVTLTGTSDFYGTLLSRLLTLAGDTQFHVDEQVILNLFGVDPVAPVLVQ